MKITCGDLAKITLANALESTGGIRVRTVNTLRELLATKPDATLVDLVGVTGVGMRTIAKLYHRAHTGEERSR